jgi:hypothetical protein
LTICLPLIFSAGQQQQQAEAGGKRKHEGGGDAEYVSAPLCSCGAGTCIVESDRQGRQFFVCQEEVRAAAQQQRCGQACSAGVLLAM